MKHCLLLFILVFTCTLPICVSAQAPRYAKVISENANLRDTPSASGVTEQEVAEATIVKVLDEKLPWYVVRVGNHVGWMHGNTLEFINIQDSVSAPQTQQIRVPDQKPSIPNVLSNEGVPDRPAPTTEVNRGYTRGPRGGCYYISASGRKVYVDHSLCN